MSIMRGYEKGDGVINRVRGSEIGKTGTGGRNWWLEATCPDCGLVRWLTVKGRIEDAKLAKQRCSKCHIRKYKQATFRSRENGP